jgi:tetratricopeptide (TPR) repeat protein
VAAALLAGLVALCAAAPAPARDADPVNLLALPTAKLEYASDPSADAVSLKALADGNAATATTLAASAQSPPSLVIGFGDNVVSLESLEISLGDAAAEQRPTQVDLLVSSLSPHAGFQSVRSDQLKGVGSPQKFAFATVGAKWIMLKFSAAPNAKAVSIADVKINGREGPPQTRYKFKESPTKAFDVLRGLQSASLNLSVSPDEASLFADARDGKLDQWSFAEAALLASGVATAAARKPYLDRLTTIEAGARQAVGAAKDPYGQGAALLKFLHAGPMKSGYSSGQTNVSTILDTGKFNCVSSAALFNILARRLGLDARAIEVPDHAFSIVYEGTQHADVETTTAAGFNPARNKAAQAEFEKLTGFSYIPDSHRDQRREVGELGLLAIIYYNHGVELTREKHYPEALLAYFRAMSLDPEFASAVNNALAVLANWSGELSRQRRFDEALKAAGIGLELAPQDAALVNNHKAVWSQWADMLMKEGKNDEALAILRRADQAIPGGGFAKMQAWVFIREGEEHVKAGNWQKALAVAQPALAKLDAAPREELTNWAGALHTRWVQSEMKRGNFTAALDILSQRLAEQPQDKRLADHLAYVVQERLRDAAAKEGPEAAEKILPELVARFDQFADVKRVATAHLQRSVQKLSDEGKYDQALVAAARMAGLVSDPKLAAETIASVYDRWALKLAKDKRWDEALDVYEKALPRLADKSRAENNIRFIVQEWVKDVGPRQSTDATKDILQRQVVRFATVKDMNEIARSYVSRAVQDLVRQKQYDAALASLESYSGLLREPKDQAQIAGQIYDRKADELRQKGDWQGAVDVYDGGLKKFPKDSHLSNNAVANWYQWSKTFMDKKDWAGAIAVYEKALERFPDNGTLNQNLKYCREQLAKSK